MKSVTTINPYLSTGGILMKLSANIDMLEVNGKQAYYPVLIHDDNNLVLVDAGFPLDFELLSNAIKSSGFKIEDINKLIITHQDIDHIGCVKELLKIVPEIEIMACSIETPYIDGRMIPTKLAKMDEANPFYKQFKVGFDNRRIKIDRELFDNEILPFCGGVEVIHSPGHTPGHICLYIKKDKIMICGDALNIDEGALIGANPMHSDNIDDAEKSRKRLLDYDVDTFLTYHGGVYFSK